MVCGWVKGGSDKSLHNEVQFALGDLAAIVYQDVVREPIVQEADDASGRPAWIADLSIRGVWQPQTAVNIARYSCHRH